MTAGPRGSLLLQDYQLIEKLAHQNRKRIPEGVVHAKGWGAYGRFTVTRGDYPLIDVGTHYEALPINAPKCPVNHYYKDGHMFKVLFN